MKLKKINAFFALLSLLGLLIHVGYSIFAYLTFYYNPSLKKLTAIPFILFTCVHAVCGMCAVFLQGDGTRLDIYRKQNMGTVIQRVSAALIFPLLILHINIYGFLKNAAADGKWFFFILLILLQILFFAVVFSHIAVSFSKAFITLGILNNRIIQKKFDRIVFVLCAALWILSVFAVVKGELKMFLLK